MYFGKPIFVVNLQAQFEADVRVSDCSGYPFLKRSGEKDNSEKHGACATPKPKWKEKKSLFTPSDAN